MRWLSLIVLLGVVGVFADDARADGPKVVLQRLPAARIRELAPRLRQHELTLFESDEHRVMKQITVMALVAAAPEVVHEMVAHPERYPEFVHNMTESKITKNADGTLDHFWKISYTVLSADSLERYVFMPPDPEHAAAPIEFYDLTGASRYRWEFIAPREGGGTILVQYGFTDMRNTHEGGFLSKVINRAPSLEYGLALATQMTLLLSVKRGAEQNPGQFPPYVAPAPGAPNGSFDFMLDRGTVALFRSDGRRLVELSLVDRTRATRERILEVAGQPQRFSEFLPCITKSVDAGTLDGMPAVEQELSLPLMTWKTIFGIARAPTAVDMLGLAGDLRGARMRWDIQEAARGRQIVLRVSERFDAASMVMRSIFHLEPLLEYGVNAGLAIAILHGVRDRAEN